MKLDLQVLDGELLISAIEQRLKFLKALFLLLLELLLLVELIHFSDVVDELLSETDGSQQLQLGQQLAELDLALQDAGFA